MDTTLQATRGTTRTRLFQIPQLLCCCRRPEHLKLARKVTENVDRKNVVRRLSSSIKALAFMNFSFVIQFLRHLYFRVDPYPTKSPRHARHRSQRPLGRPSPFPLTPFVTQPQPESVTGKTRQMASSAELRKSVREQLQGHREGQTFTAWRFRRRGAAGGNGNTPHVAGTPWSRSHRFAHPPA